MQVKFGIDIEIFQLNQIHIGLFHQFNESFDFRFIIIYARANQQVYMDEETVFLGVFDEPAHIGKFISFRAEIVVEIDFPGAVKRYSH